jgi:SAM-dependent methyltransferase
VHHCRSKGLTAYCESIESFLHSVDDHAAGFDVAAAFHCLEHVSDPKEFVASMVRVLKPGGKIYLSTPYSPMSFEGIWLDPLNNPPHHLTRWNFRAYKELARQLNLQINFFMPRASGILHRTLYALNLAWYGPFALASRKKMFLSVLAHPFDTLDEYMRQRSREKVDGKTVADVILVELSRSN